MVVIGATDAVDGQCPAHTLRHECSATPGKICCAGAVAALAMYSYACVAVPAGCEGCACMPGDVCGQVEVCAAIEAGRLTCRMPA